jgi:hypothetical protein
VGGELVGFAAVAGGGRKDVVGGRESAGFRALERLFEFVERVAAVLENEAQIAQHVGVERDRAGEKKSDPSPRTEAVAKEVGAALVADAAGVFGEFPVGGNEAVAEVADGGRDDGEDGGPVSRCAGAGEGDVLQRDLGGVFEEVDHAFDLVDQPASLAAPMRHSSLSNGS